MSSPIRRSSSFSGLVDDRVEVELDRPQQLLAAEGEQLPRELGGAVGGRVDLADVASPELRVARASGAASSL